VIKGTIDSAIDELSKLDDASDKFSTGWWKRLRYFNKSIGGQEDPSILDVCESINSRYTTRAMLDFSLAAFFLFMAGFYAKRARKESLYHVEYE
jgi:hypothetical protein